MTSGFFFQSVLPPELIDVRAIAEWCPTCLSAAGPHPLTPRLHEYLAIQAAYYRMPIFTHAGSKQPKPSNSFDIPRGVTRDVVRNNSFLTVFFGLQPDS